MFATRLKSSTAHRTRDDNSFFEKEARRYGRLYEGFSWNLYEKIYVKRRIDEVMAYVPQFNTDPVLDAGCGSGHLLENVRRRTPTNRIGGFDLSLGMVEIARSLSIPGADLFVGSVASMAVRSAAFKVVFCIGVIPYVDTIEDSLRELSRVLQDGGSCIVTYPYKNCVVNFLRENPLGLWIRKHALKTAHYHVRMEISEFRDTCNRLGFDIAGEKKLHFSEMLFHLRKRAG
jgi:ubiquinone/menaquinone biosynthesis C-methylase UbiE